MFNSVREFLKTTECNGKKVAVACSGGSDSMALLHAINSLKKDFSLSLVCLHYDHGIREESNLDAIFVKRFCDINGIPFIMEKGNVPLLAFKNGQTLEMAAREARYAFFERASRENDIYAVMVAHHLEDNIESILLHFIRGSGISGLIGMSEIRNPNIWRPMLDVKKEDILNYIEENAIEYREDVTNQDIKYTRNFLRKDIIPKLLKINPNLYSALRRTSDILRAENEFMDTIANRLLDSFVDLSDGVITIKTKDLNELHISIRRRVLRNSISALFGLTDISLKNIEDIIVLCEKSITNKEVSIKRALIAQIEYGELKIYKNTSGKKKLFTESLNEIIEFDKAHDKIIEIKDFCIEIKKSFDKDLSCKDENEEYLDLDKLPRSTVFRGRQTGDFIYPLNLGGKKKLKDYLSDKKIPLEKRNELVVLAHGPEVFWVSGIGISQRVALSEETKNILLIRLFKI